MEGTATETMDIVFGSEEYRLPDKTYINEWNLE
jgi:hypothetical protein